MPKFKKAPLCLRKLNVKNILLLVEDVVLNISSLQYNTITVINEKYDFSFIKMVN